MYQNKRNIQISAFLLSVFSAVSLYGCSAGSNPDGEDLTPQISTSVTDIPETVQNGAVTGETAEVTEPAESKQQTDEEEIITVFSPLSTGLLTPDKFFTARDLRQNADRNGAEKNCFLMIQ